MCLKPIKIRNPTKNIYNVGGQQLLMSVKCNRCAECTKQKRTEWHFRSYHHVNKIINKGGYVYFDTLTYSDDNVPRLSDFIDTKKYKCKDFMCFNIRHWQLFLKNLRRQIHYHCKDIKFTYFLVSEYGTDERYTHRPHYHILFYVESKKLHPLDLSRLVSKCWKYGITDGIAYKPLPHVAEHVYGFDLGFGKNNSPANVLSVCNYVSKYVTKSSKFQATLDKRKEYLSRQIDDTELLKSLFKTVDMYHKQSRGFGLSYLETLLDEDIENLAYNPICLMPSQKHVVTTLPMPMYYIRHLFYQNVRRSDGTYYWQLNERGKRFAINKMLYSVQRINDKYLQQYINLKHDDKKQVDELLKERTLRDFVIYKVFYQGRLRYSSSLSYRRNLQTSRLNDTEYNIYDWLQIVKQTYDVNKQDVSLLFNQSENFVSIPVHGYMSDIFDYDTQTINIPYDVFVDRFTFNQRSNFLNI